MQKAEDENHRGRHQIRPIDRPVEYRHYHISRGHMSEVPKADGYDRQDRCQKRGSARHQIARPKIEALGDGRAHGTSLPKSPPAPAAPPTDGSTVNVGASVGEERTTPSSR